MNEFLIFFNNMISQLFGVLNSATFTVAGFTVSYFGLVVGFILLGIFISAFWKGVQG